MTLLTTLLAQNPLDKEITIPGLPTEVVPTDAGAAGGGTPVANVISVALGFFTILGGLMFLVYFIFAALKWVTSGGDKGKVEGAKTQMTNAAIGLAIVVTAQAVVGIAGKVLGLDILNPVTMLGKIWSI